MTESEKKHLATTFIQSLKARDPVLLASVTHPDVVWSIPGTCLVSGEAKGVDGIIARANNFAKYSLNIEILYVLYGFKDVALSLHNTGTHAGRVLDEHLTTMCHLRDGKIARLDTLISDVQMLNDYFA